MSRTKHLDLFCIVTDEEIEAERQSLYKAIGYAKGKALTPFAKEVILQLEFVSVFIIAVILLSSINIWTKPLNPQFTIHICDQACKDQPRECKLHQVIFLLISLALNVVSYFHKFQKKAH